MEKKLYTISVYSENNLGLLNRISTIFVKRHINIESLTVSASEIENVSRFVVVVNMTEEAVKKIIGQLEKQVEVIQAYYHTDDEIIFTETAMFKFKSDLLFENPQIQNIIKEHSMNIVTVNRTFFIVEKAGRRHEIDAIYDAFAPFGIAQFVRSGRVAISKEAMNIRKILGEIVQ
ncbi:acetolactate synthase small subunit [Wenyingzhuangia aestuarii]|uniref:acetolactate synthase small subunit n=1 Tax=Wenyingzhuangia aestuarii TaxID=1647582 RepID=UPI001438EC01|nr:acetolactate synthase small subunit [Wenyingzhuangia aestuarii]NJB81623.1 acetolactate synthase-1/3 small subunit [Wenyingzhuangia aestuarii]